MTSSQLDISPLRQRMIDDMRMRQLVRGTSAAAYRSTGYSWRPKRPATNAICSCNLAAFH
ncbi:UNVERIFIED_ORG: hypothetical protein ABIC62_006710 [Burkholderia sp. 1595]|uniref:Uncharacterized protein n=1 Tax=Paraburkholderia terricola TaxID=169427 RepID=A0ABU1M2P0_9BURK|nr:hypothetical protein [Paraburkholderia terricola]